MRKKARPKMKKLKKMYGDIFKTIEELRSDKITPKEANKRAKAMNERIRKTTFN